MGTWKKDQGLLSWQTMRPVLWMHQIELAPGWGPDVSDAFFRELWGPGNERRIKTWGRDAATIHYLASRAGTAMHTDPKYPRYTHHLTLRNDGWRIHGLDTAVEQPPILRGTVLCLDTHSPHQVSRDPRLAAGIGAKIAIAIDSATPYEFPAVLEMLLASPRCLDKSPLDVVNLK